MAKTVLITGTSTGIGAACVKRQAAAGWKVAQNLCGGRISLFRTILF